MVPIPKFAWAIVAFLIGWKSLGAALYGCIRGGLSDVELPKLLWYSRIFSPSETWPRIGLLLGDPVKACTLRLLRALLFLAGLTGEMDSCDSAGLSVKAASDLVGDAVQAASFSSRDGSLMLRVFSELFGLSTYLGLLLRVLLLGRDFEGVASASSTFDGFLAVFLEGVDVGVAWALRTSVCCQHICANRYVGANVTYGLLSVLVSTRCS